MPITKEEFERHQQPLAQRILEVLERNPGKAFSIIEIMEVVEGYTDAFSLAVAMWVDPSLQKKYATVMAALVLQGRVQHAEVRGGSYYTARS